MVRAQANCNGVLDFTYSNANAFSIVGDTLQVDLLLGAGTIPGGTTLEVSRLRFELACVDFIGSGFVGCQHDAGASGSPNPISFDDDIQTTCGVVWVPSIDNSAGIPGGTKNEVVFTATTDGTTPTTVNIPAGTASFCTFSFRIKVDNHSGNADPNRILQAVGYSQTALDAVCDNGENAGSQQSGSFDLCPVCRNPLICEQSVNCNQDTGQCTDISFLPATTTCRDAAGPCDVAESCTGDSAACPADTFTPATTICRDAAGPCDVAESCTGNSAACPADALAPATTICRVSAGDCDTAESCTGNSAACPADALAPATTICRDAAGPCDVAESCTGNSAACPVNAFTPATTICRDAARPCDAEESCTGNSAACPADTFRPATTICRDAAGPCDAAESCTGNSAACPPDTFQPQTTICRPIAGVCDVAESCTGNGVDCPADGFLPATTICRTSPNPSCDPEESCPGDSPACPPDVNNCGGGGLGEHPYIGIVGNDAVTGIGLGNGVANPYYFSQKHQQFLYDQDLFNIPVCFGTFPLVTPQTRVGGLGCEQFRSNSPIDQPEVCDSTGTVIEGGGNDPDTFTFFGEPNAVIRKQNAGYFEWFIRLPAKPSGEINICIQCGILKPNTFAFEKFDAIDLCAAETGERIGTGFCARDQVAPGVNPIVAGALPTIRAVAYPGPYSLGFTPFLLTAYKNPGLYGGGDAIGAMADAASFQLLDGTANARVLLKACMDKCIVVKIPVTGQLNAAGGVEADLEPGDLIQVTMDILITNTVDIYCHSQSARLVGIGEAP